MQPKEVILKSLAQSQDYLTQALDGLTQEESAWSPGPECNSISFILWHMFRVEDFFVNRVLRREGELYETEGWRDKLGTPAKETGYQYTAEQLKAFVAPPLDALRGYSQSLRGKTLDLLEGLSPEKFDEVPRPDRSPDSVGDIVGRITTEIALHTGQIAYLRGMQRGLDK